MRKPLRTFVTLLCLALASFAARAQNYSDIWWNPSESGWGLTIADHNSNLFAVWFTYRQDGKPIWYVIPGGTFTNGHKHFEGDIYATTGPAFSSASFDPSRVAATKVGTATLDFSSFTAGSFTYSLSGVTRTKAISRQPFGNATPLWGGDVTDIWWNPAESGWGLTLAQHGNNVFGVWFTYDTDGQPLWAVMPGVSFNGRDAFTGTLYTTTGPAFSSPTFDPSQVTVKSEGTATITVSRSGAAGQCGSAKTAALQTTLRGSSRQSSICQQPFGSPAALPDYPSNPRYANAAAYLASPADPLDATITTDSSGMVSQLVTPAGGTITASDAAGNKFTLDIPPHALMSETAISMTPITKVTGPKYASGVALGLKLEPDGLVLLRDAILTVEPATPIPVESQVGFSADGDGRNLHGEPPGPDFTRMQLPLPHFSFWGWLFMSASERAAEARMAQADAAEHRIRDAISRLLTPIKNEIYLGARDSADPGIGGKDMTALLEEYYREVVKVRIDAASGGCGFAGTAFDTLMNFSRSRATSGAYGDDPQIPDFVTDMEKLRVAFGQLKDKTPCYFYEHATYTALHGADMITTDIKAYWRAVSQVEQVVTYKALRGGMKIDFEPPPGCKLTNPNHPLTEGKANSGMDIDWGFRRYQGAGGAVPTITLACTPPPAISFEFPVFYLGDLLNPPQGLASGPVHPGGAIGPETRSFGVGSLTYTFTAVCPNDDDAIFCGNRQIFYD